MISKTKAATDLQINGSMLLKRNNIFELILKSTKNKYFSVISAKISWIGSYYKESKRTENKISPSFDWHKVQILNFSGVLGTVCLPVSMWS